MKEKEIIKLLRKDARQSLAAIARKAGMPRHCAARALRKCNKYIKKYTIIPDFRAMGFEVHAMFFLAPKSRKLMQYLDSSYNVNALFTAAGPYPVIVFAIFREMHGFYMFDKELGKLCNAKRVNFIVDEVKQENA
ncbi:MAG: hypothetical protein KJ955_07075 [Nanoarchaeota archaeon]|nr:hypothetical protein [Nanoarchaeota archaeon]